MSNTLKTDQKIIPIEELLKNLNPQDYEKVSNAIVRNAASQRACNDPLPGPMQDAVLDEKIEVQTSQGIVNVRKMVIYDTTLFKKFNSPFYRQLLESSKQESEKEDISYTDEESYEMVYQFLNPPLAVKRSADKGRDYFTNIAVEEIALKYDFNDIQAIITAISTQILKAFSTLVQHGVKETDSMESLINKYQDADEQKVTEDKKK